MTMDLRTIRGDLDFDADSRRLPVGVPETAPTGAFTPGPCIAAARRGAGRLIYREVGPRPVFVDGAT
jgi:hypothetical protein